MSDMFDVIVVGSGSAGGAAASRLSENPDCRVLLIEAGPDFPDEELSPPSFMSGGAVIGERGAGIGAPGPAYDWGFHSEPLPDGRTIPLPRAKMVGGTSMINGSVAVRGRPEDYAAWVACGADGWGFDELRPVFERVERLLRVKTYSREQWLPAQKLLVDAWLELGLRWCDDLNGAGAWNGVVGPWPRSRHNETRMGSLNTYIRAARTRPNFSLRSDAMVDRVMLSGSRATGVRYLDARGTPQEVYGDIVVLSAGAYGSAPILLRSGIGPARSLKRTGIGVAVDLPVGSGLMDHPSLPFVTGVNQRFASMGWPHLAAVARGHGWWAAPMPIDEERSQILVAFCLATTEGPEGGEVAIATADPTAPPVIRHNYDRAIEAGAFDCVFEAWEQLMETSVMQNAGATDLTGDDRQRSYARKNVRTGTHPAGGCAIGSVVDANLHVLGIDGLLVADASVLPKHVTNNPNLTCHAVGEVAAARILEPHRLEESAAAREVSAERQAGTP
jgi:choline dehydrogenase